MAHGPNIPLMTLKLGLQPSPDGPGFLCADISIRDDDKLIKGDHELIEASQKQGRNGTKLVEHHRAESMEIHIDLLLR